MAHKKPKKKKSKVKFDLPSLSEIPAFFPAPGIGALALTNPVVAGALLGYTVAEKTQGIWGPPVEAHAQATRADVDRFMQQFKQFKETGPASVGGGRTGFVPQTPTGIPIPAPFAMAEAPVKRTRKVTKANKATKKAWKILTRGRKGKLTKSACQKLLKKCSMMASKANPNTKSRIGTAKNGTTKACKKIRKEIWGTTKRYKK
jgi:hypothetical protein